MQAIQSQGWIWHEDARQNPLRENQIVEFCRVMDFPKRPQEMFLDITADAKYKLYINGQLINVGPQKGDQHIHYVDHLDVTAHLQAGKNIFLIKVLAVPNLHNKGNHSFHRTDTPGLYVKGHYLLDEAYSFLADESWSCKVVDVKLTPESQGFSPLCIFESAHGSNLCRINGEDDLEDWQGARVYGGHEFPFILRPESLVERQIPLLFLQQEHFDGIQCIRQSQKTSEDWMEMLIEDETVTLAANSKEIIEISAGEETTGYLRIVMSGGAGSQIKVLTSECYAYEPQEGFGDFAMPLKGDRTDHVKGKLYGFTDTYGVAGTGTPSCPETYEPFWFRTFRYIRLEVTTQEEPLTLQSFDYLKTGYPLEVVSQVTTSDQSLEGIWDISERSLRCCMHETYEDTPFYEQLQYTMDSRSQILYTYATAADDRLARQCMDDFKRAGKHDGVLGCSYPNYETNVIPSFSVYYIGMVHDHMMYFGDKTLVLEHMSTITGVLNYFRKNLDDRGLVKKLGGPLFQMNYWSFVDWTEQWKETIGVPPATKQGPLTMESLHFIMGLQYAADLFEYVGYDNLASSLRAEAQVVQTAVNTYCRGQKGMYTDGPGVEDYSQHTQIYALLTDTVSISEGRKLIEETFVNKDQYAQCSVAMMYYVFRALEKCDLYERTNELWDVWRDMLKKNLTTCEEDSVTSRSDCHAWGALALFELPSVILGVRPSAPGYSRMTIKPLAGHLQWAKGQVITPKGTVSVKWEKGDEQLLVETAVPYGIQVDSGSERHIVKMTRY